MLIVLQLDCGVLPPAGTTHFSRFGLTRTDTTYIAGVDRRQFSVFRCVVGRPLRLLCTSCPVQLFTRHFFRLAYCRDWLAHFMPGLFVCRLDSRITALCARSHNHAIQGVSVLLRVQSLVAVGLTATSVFHCREGRGFLLRGPDHASAMARSLRKSVLGPRFEFAAPRPT